VSGAGSAASALNAVLKVMHATHLYGASNVVGTWGANQIPSVVDAACMRRLGTATVHAIGAGM
jgi:hypothetical protein